MARGIASSSGVRYYSESEDVPVFLEIKRRANDAIIKHRCPIRRRAAAQVIAGQLPSREDFIGNNPRTKQVAEQFVTLVAEMDARPAARISYHREAWVSSGDSSTRVTIDRRIRFAAAEGGALRPVLATTQHQTDSRVILELKFTARFPEWCQELVRVFDLERCSASKYSEGIEQFGETRLQSTNRERDFRATTPLPRAGGKHLVTSNPN